MQRRRVIVTGYHVSHLRIVLPRLEEGKDMEENVQYFSLSLVRVRNDGLEVDHHDYMRGYSSLLNYGRVLMVGNRPTVP